MHGYVPQSQANSRVVPCLCANCNFTRRVVDEIQSRSFPLFVRNWFTAPTRYAHSRRRIQAAPLSLVTSTGATRRTRRAQGSSDPRANRDLSASECPLLPITKQRACRLDWRQFPFPSAREMKALCRSDRASQATLLVSPPPPDGRKFRRPVKHRRPPSPVSRSAGAKSVSAPLGFLDIAPPTIARGR